MKRACATLLSCAAALAAIVAPVSNAHASSSTASSSVVTLCTRDQHRAVAGPAVIRNSNSGKQAECITNIGGGANFTLSKSAATIPWSAYPNIFRGCEWGACSSDGSFPERVSSLHRLWSTWRYSAQAPGQWNAAYDLWFDPHPRRNGQVTGTEIMLWLDIKNMPAVSGWPVLRIDGASWQFLHWRTFHNGTSWNYIQFRRVHADTYVHNLNLIPFMQRAEAAGKLPTSWYLTAVEAGFEICRNGTGLATQNFSVSR
jgi:hypothetical protein